MGTLVVATGPLRLTVSHYPTLLSLTICFSSLLLPVPEELRPFQSQFVQARQSSFTQRVGHRTSPDADSHAPIGFVRCRDRYLNRTAEEEAEFEERRAQRREKREAAAAAAAVAAADGDATVQEGAAETEGAQIEEPAQA